MLPDRFFDELLKNLNLIIYVFEEPVSIIKLKLIIFIISASGMTEHPVRKVFAYANEQNIIVQQLETDPQ